MKEYSFYTSTVNQIINIAKTINLEQHRHFPVWATCLGFEALILGESNLNISFSDVHNENYSQSVSFVNKENDFVRFFNPDDVALMQEKKMFFFNHEHAFFLDAFAANPDLVANYRVIASSFSRTHPDSMPIIAIIESRAFPFYGVQFHPEKNSYEPKIDTDKSPEAV